MKIFGLILKTHSNLLRADLKTVSVSNFFLFGIATFFHWLPNRILSAQNLQ